MAIGHIVDGNTVALWRWLLSAPWVSDVVATWNQLSEQGVASLRLPGVIVNSRGFTSNTSQKLNGPSGQAALSSSLWQSEWTIEAWVCTFGSQPAADVGNIFIFNGIGVAQSDNIQASLGIVGTGGGNAGKLLCRWRRGAAGNVDTLSPTALTVGVWTHVAAVKQSAGGGIYNCLLYVNGVLVTTNTGLNNADGGTSGNMRGGVGGDPGFADSALNAMVDEVCISNTPRAASYILADYQRTPGLQAQIATTRRRIRP
jgi:hypothetical protein